MRDVCIIGGGIVGLATAHALMRARPGIGITVLEQERQPGLHQTGHNSGVIHSGIYYAPGSLKARLCREGAQATKDFCAENAIPVEVCGKHLVATNALEANRMEALEQRARENGIAYERIDAAELRRREPAISGVGALFIPATGIVDYQLICQVLARQIEQSGGDVVYGARVDRIEETPAQVNIHAAGRVHAARHMVACAGLQSDRIAALGGLAPDFQIVPFRGEYYRLPANRKDLVKTLIYPVPDPDLPFLGIHLTRMIDGGITVGPNAVLGFAREKYPKFSISFQDVREMLGFPGFWRVIRANLRSGLTEMRNSVQKRGYLEMCRKYCPDLTLADLRPQEAGIRAQAVLRDGTLVHDFLIKKTARSVYVCNAPSPAATSALPIGRMIAEELAQLTG
ncbi:L-2-hydroxyglutarate oxidase [Acidocella sp.]|uniref:L-2-hydroxyglutarate oxidase n=1 Tax=Acidocella sp. TaxID=50710 RepID=UPI003D007DD1